MSVIDPLVFSELKLNVGDDFVVELIDVFLDEAPKMLRNMHAAVVSGDLELFRRNAHSLKSNAAAFGATELAALAKEMETLARSGSLDVESRLAALEAAYQQAALALQELCK